MVSKDDRGRTFGSRSDWEEAVRRQSREELAQALSPEVLGRFRSRLDALNAFFERELESYQAVATLVSAVDRAHEVATRIAGMAGFVPRVMVCTRLLATFAADLEDLRAALNLRLNLAADDAIREASNLRPDEDIGFSFWLERWGDALQTVSWPKKPRHRARVIMALQQCGAVATRPSFRLIAVASLASGGEIATTFRPGETTVAMAIRTEINSVGYDAIKLNPSWASDLEVSVAEDPTDQIDVEVGFVSLPDLDDVGVDEAA